MTFNPKELIVRVLAFALLVSCFASLGLAHGPTFPPDPWENHVTHGPTFPPDPWENHVTHGPTFPPDPWEKL